MARNGWCSLDEPPHQDRRAAKDDSFCALELPCQVCLDFWTPCALRLTSANPKSCFYHRTLKLFYFVICFRSAVAKKSFVFHCVDYFVMSTVLQCVASSLKGVLRHSQQLSLGCDWKSLGITSTAELTVCVIYPTTTKRSSAV